MRRLALALPLFALLLGACDPEARLGPSCPVPAEGGLLLWNGVESFVPGAAVPLVPFHATRPGAYEALDASCLRRIELSPEEAGRIERTADGTVTLRIADDAPLGEVFGVRADYGGQVLRSRFSVYLPERSPLVGYWRQTPHGCAPDSAIGELVFSADGTFSVTWQPFEAYRDYWGTWDHDPASGWLELTVEGGNNTPVGVASGTVVVDAAGMALVSASFGRRREHVPECRNPFPR